MVPTSRAYLLLLLSGLVTLAGCPSEPTFGTGGGTGDDDDDSAEAIAPIVEVAYAEGSEGVISVGLQVFDEGGRSVDAEVEWRNADLAAGTEDGWQPVTLCDGASLTALASGPEPGGEIEHSFGWTSDLDFSSDLPNVELRARGSAGVTVGDWYRYPETEGIVILNGTRSTTGAFDEVGALQGIRFDEGEALVPLNDGTIGDNRDMQFAIVLVNAGEEDAEFDIVVTSEEPLPNSCDETDIPPPPPPGDDDDDDDTSGDDDDSAMGDDDDDDSAMSSDWSDWDGFAGTRGGCVPAYNEDDIASIEREFWIRDELEPAGPDEAPSQARTTARLIALGEGVNVFWDNSDPIDFFSDCASQDPAACTDDGDASCQRLGVGDPSGISNCAIERAVDVIDYNILPNLHYIWGVESDVDNNCAINLVISRRLNQLTRENELYEERLVRSYAQPEADLVAFSELYNPHSNEGETVFIHGPDPDGYANSATPVDPEAWVGLELAGQAAMAIQDLISFSRLNSVSSTLLTPTEDGYVGQDGWLNEGLRYLAADLTGFGAVVYRDAWRYMDAPYLHSLVAEEIPLFGGGGGQYLFARYLYDQYGGDFVAAATSQFGLGAITTLTGDSFPAILREWAAAMVVSGLTREDGTPLVGDSIVRNFDASAPIVVATPGEPPPSFDSGNFYGANGFQQGFNIRGLNRTYRDGFSSEARELRELVAQRVKTEGLDWQSFNADASFDGVVASNGGVAYILVSGLNRPSTNLMIRTAEEGLRGSIVRLPDIGDWEAEPPVFVEQVLSARQTDIIDIPSIPDDGNQIVVIGTISESEGIETCDVDSAEAGGDEAGDDDDDSAEDFSADIQIADTDLYGFEIPEPTNWRVAMWLDRRFASGEGDVAATLADPWMAVVQTADVPDITALSGTCPASCEEYPIRTLAHQLAQRSISSNPTAPALTADQLPVPDGEIYTCDEDFDLDGVPDVAELGAASIVGFADQVRLMQFETAAVDSSAYDSMAGTNYFPYTTDFIDVDSSSTGETSIYATANMRYNTGGRAAPDGPEAYIEVVLPPGNYTLVVGGGVDTGPYEVAFRRLTD